MNSCFEKFVDFKGIMSDGLDRIVASKNSVPILVLLKLLKRMYFFLISSNYWNTVVNFNLLMRQINLWEI